MTPINLSDLTLKTFQRFCDADPAGSVAPDCFARFKAWMAEDEEAAPHAALIARRAESPL